MVDLSRQHWRHAVLAAVIYIALPTWFRAVDAPSARAQGADPQGAAIFDLIDQHGRRFNSDQLKGMPYAIFFGFTQCPEVCPTTLNDLTGVVEQLGPTADRIRFLFVSVDVEGDTPETLSAYLQHFDRRILGLTGHPAEIISLVGKFGAFFERVPTKHGYTINHSTSIYLVDRAGRRAGTITYQEPAARQIKNSSG